MKILVIEDEHRVANIIKGSLEQENYSVDVAFDGDEGYKLIQDNQYDLYVIGWNIPGSKNGIEIIKSMRQIKLHNPVILISDKSDTGSKKIGLSSGADDYLIKPFSVQKLLVKVKSLLNDNSRQDILSIDNLSVDTTRFEAKRGDTIIHLTNKEFSLLEYLMRNQGKPLNKDMISNYVWNYDADVMPNTVEVYIKYLRQKIDDPFDKKLIHTVRGFGYKIDDK